MKQKKIEKPSRFLKCSKDLLTPTRADALVLRVEHWTPKGDCKVTGNKERNQLQFYEGNPVKKKLTKKIKSPSNLH